MITKLSANFRSVWLRFSSTHKAALVSIQPVTIASFFTVALVLAIRQIGGLQSLELGAFDQMMRLRADAGPDPRLLLVAITQDDIARYKFPFSDRIVAQALRTLQQYQPRVIGLDLFRDLPQEPGHTELLAQLKDAKNVITIMSIGTEEDPGTPPPPTVPVEQIGFNDVVTDPDGVVRRNLMFADTETETVSAFSLQVALTYLTAQNITPNNNERNPNEVEWGQAVFRPLEASSGSYQTIDDRGYQILLNYRTASQVARQVTLSQLLENQVPPAWVKDKIVLIGTTAPSIRDLFFTPYSAAEPEKPSMSGVQIHAQMISQLLDAVLGNRGLFWFWPDWLEAVWIGGWAFAGGMLTWHIRHPLRLGLLEGAALGLLFIVCFGVSTQMGWVPWVAPALTLVGTSAVVIAYKPLYEALHDPLTGLPNWTLFMNRLRRSVDHARRGQNYLFAVLFLDVDRFKYVNESLGHQVGDQLLVEIARRIEVSLRAKDTVARIGGDEFTILLEDIKSIHEATQTAERLQQQLMLPFALHNQQIFLTTSIGIVWGISGYDWAEDLLRDAHTAMYHAKASGKARCQVFNTNMRVEIVTLWQLETDLRYAVERQEFELYYQPLVSLATGKIAGFEALIRWKHPQHGLISPSKFIPVAEETGLIVAIGRWALQKACEQLRIWQEKFPPTDTPVATTSPLVMSVNLSGKQFSDPRLVDQIAQVLQVVGLDARYLKLEITESMVMENVETAIALLQELKQLNIKLSVDDFGTGYSSLSYLHRFPIDTLKVDQSFIRHIGQDSESTRIVRTVITLAHDLNMEVIAEGVETVEQLVQLRALNCEYGQGYLFGKPLDWETAEALLATDPQW